VVLWVYEGKIQHIYVEVIIRSIRSLFRFTFDMAVIVSSISVQTWRQRRDPLKQDTGIICLLGLLSHSRDRQNLSLTFLGLYLFKMTNDIRHSITAAQQVRTYAENEMADFFSRFEIVTCSMKRMINNLN